MKNYRTCPYCGYDKCTAETVDIGIGEEQCGPYVCERCGAVEIGFETLYNNQEKSKLTKEEQKIGWYKGVAS